MKIGRIALLCLPLLLSSCRRNDTPTPVNPPDNPVDPTPTYDVVINEEEYYDKTLGAITAALWGNFSGLPTEFKFITSPCSEELPWLVSETYSTDDDTSLEYVFTHTMETYGVNDVTYTDIVREWKDHIRDYIWVGNESAKKLMDQGYLPPDTGSKKYNPNYRAIDAQIECEVFGLIAPGMKTNAKERCEWWMASVCDGEAKDCASFYSALCAELYIEPNAIKAIENVMELYDDTSNAKAIASKVLSLRENEKITWLGARQKLYEDYYLYNPGRKKDTLDCEINFSMVLMALAFGNNDFKETGQIALRAGFDNDCNAATACMMMGIALGYEGLPEDLKEKSGIVYTNTNRPGLPNDTTTNWSERICKLGKQNMLENKAIIENKEIKVNDANYISNDYSTFNEEIYEASNEALNGDFQLIYNPEFSSKYGLASDTKNEELTFTFSGEMLSIYAQTAIESGSFEIFVDETSYGIINLDQSETITLGQNIDHISNTLVKRIYHLENKEHNVKIVNLMDSTIEIDHIGYGTAE